MTSKKQKKIILSDSTNPIEPKPIEPIHQVQKKEPINTKKVIDFSQYTGFIDYHDGNVQFDNPYTGRAMVIPKYMNKCPITGKEF